MGKTELDAAIIDSVMGCSDDIASGLISLRYGGLNEEQIKAKGEKLATDTVPKILEYFETTLSKEGFLTSTNAVSFTFLLPKFLNFLFFS